jgi:hypothetical protein
MTEFEYLAVFMSIIFGISTTHILTGAIRSIYRGQVNHTHFVLTAFFFFVLILNWWVGFKWAQNEIWHFGHFIVIVIWSISHYVAAITLYPPQAASAEHPFEYRHNWFLIAFSAAAALDIAQTSVRGDLFNPPAYLPFVSHYIVVSMIAIFINKKMFHRVLAWYLLLVTITWTFIQRFFLN